MEGHKFDTTVLEERGMAVSAEQAAEEAKEMRDRFGDRKFETVEPARILNG